MVKRLIVVVLLVLAAHQGMAQGCAVCTKTAAGLGSNTAKGLNAGSLYLAALPLALLGTVGFVWYKRTKNGL